MIVKHFLAAIFSWYDILPKIMSSYGVGGHKVKSLIKLEKNILIIFMNICFYKICPCEHFFIKIYKRGFTKTCKKFQP